ncbi:hypothetical protein C1645_773846, partial [Glomus cerebriforme]
MDSSILLLFLLLLSIINSKNVVYAQNSNCSSQNDSPCVILNNLLNPCGGAFSPPPDNVQTFEYSVDNGNLAKCMCSQNVYDTLSSCISCYSNGNSNIKAADFTDYQKSCQNFGYTFGPPINDVPQKPHNVVMIVSIGVAILIFIFGCLLIWYWYRVRSKKMERER